MSLVIIEDIQEDGSAEWSLSFTNSNPEAKDCFQMIDSQTAFRLKEYLNDLDEKVKKLQHEYDTSRGLWCVDKNPKETDLEWIRSNCFQLS